MPRVNSRGLSGGRGLFGARNRQPALNLPSPQSLEPRMARHLLTRFTVQHELVHSPAAKRGFDSKLRPELSFTGATHLEVDHEGPADASAIGDLATARIGLRGKVEGWN